MKPGPGYWAVVPLTVYALAGITVVYTHPNKPTLLLAGLIPTVKDGQVFPTGSGVLPAVRLALRHVNEQPGVLDDYWLDIAWNDTQVKLTGV